MLYAIHKETKRTVSAFEILTNASFQFENEQFLACPDMIQNWDEVKVKYQEIKVIYVHEKEVTNYNGKRFGVAPHFRIPNATKLGINVIPESREHKMAKNWVYSKLKNNDLELWYSQRGKPFEYKNHITLNELNIDIECIDIEVIVSLGKRRIADVLLPFKNRHLLLGDGIVFEIQFSKQRETTKEERTYDWGVRGYSVCWLEEKDFEKLSETNIELKNNAVKIDTFITILRNISKTAIKNLKLVVQEQSRLLDNKKDEIITAIKNTETSVILGLQSRYASLQRQLNSVPPICRNCNIPMMTKPGNDKKPFWGCPNYRINGCRYMREFITL